VFGNLQPFILEHLGTIARHLNDTRVFSFLHIPVQAGSDRWGCRFLLVSSWRSLKTACPGRLFLLSLLNICTTVSTCVRQLGCQSHNGSAVQFPCL